MDKRSLNKVLTLLIRESCVRGHIDSAKVKKVLKAIRALPYPRSIIVLREYKRRIEPLLANDTLTIESTVVLKRAQISAIVRAFKRKHSFVNIAREINLDLFGGLRIHIGSLVYDLSVAGRIDRFKDKFLNV
ncbi:MAG: F0F1 ATP synthase subunit delta [bacterium]|nr:F0F1 ATP synthase subunit delta [bacterium]